MGKLVTGSLKRGENKMGWTTWYLVDEKGRLLNTEPVCSTPDKYHLWFERFLEGVQQEYLGRED